MIESINQLSTIEVSDLLPLIAERIRRDNIELTEEAKLALEQLTTPASEHQIQQKTILSTIINPTEDQKHAVFEILSTDKILSIAELDGLVKKLHGVRFNDYKATKRLYDRIKNHVDLLEAALVIGNDRVLNSTVQRSETSIAQFSWLTEAMKERGQNRKTSVTFPAFGVR